MRREKRDRSPFYTRRTYPVLALRDVPDGWMFEKGDTRSRTYTQPAYYKRDGRIIEVREFGRSWTPDECGLTLDSLCTVIGPTGRPAPFPLRLLDRAALPPA